VKPSRYNVWVHRDDAVYLFNGISGSLLRMTQPEYDAFERFLRHEEPSGCPVKLLEQMAHGRMLIPDDGDELDLLELRYRSSRFDRTRFALTLVTSLGCNFDCPYCFEAKHPSIMNDDVVDAILRVVDDQLPHIHTLSVSWFGGEPLVGKAPLLALSDAFIERCDRGGVRYDAFLITNGYLLDERTCRQLAERRVIHTQVSLDGPPEVHDRMRPLVNGKGTFWRIVRNLHHAVEHLEVSIRINVDTTNFGHTEELLQILQAEGLSGKLTVNTGQIVGVDDGVLAPSASYSAPCFTNREYAQAELEFSKLAHRYGFGGPSLASPLSTPCTAVRANELVVGSKGELYKCWESVGNEREEIGTIWDYSESNGRLQRWLKYDPFSDPECRSCVALPVCMGGCAHHAMDLLQHENRCDPFRHTYREQIEAFVEVAEPGQAFLGPAELARPMDRR
jgi:uncharacterized protein